MKLILKIAAGIILAFVVVLILRVVIVGFMLNGANEIARERMDKQRQAAASKEQRVRQEKQETVERDRKAKELARHQAEYRRKKDEAWRNYYIDPVDCLVFRSDRHMVECVDNKKKTRNEFDRLYDRGALP